MPREVKSCPSAADAILRMYQGPDKTELSEDPAYLAVVSSVKEVELAELKVCQKMLDKAIKALIERRLVPCIEIQQVDEDWCFDHCSRECPDEECWKKFLEEDTDGERTESGPFC